jgi:hypothetical protein
MNRFEQQIAAELQKENPDEQLLFKLEFIINNGAITLAEWEMLKLVSSKEDFLKDNPDAVLRDDCISVITYLGGYYIQQLDSEKFYINDEIPPIDSIDIAQQELWLLCAEELWVDEN